MKRKAKATVKRKIQIYAFLLRKGRFVSNCECQLFLVVQYKNKCNAIYHLYKMTEYLLMLMAHIPTVPCHLTLRSSVVYLGFYFTFYLRSV